MSKVFLCAIVSSALLLGGCGSDEPAEPQTEAAKPRTSSKPRQHPGSFKRQITKTVAARYLLYLPKDYGKAKKNWPLVLFLHGARERGDDVEKVKVNGLPKLVAQGRDFPFIIVSPQCPLDGGWPTDVLNALLDEMVENYDVDADRIYLTGLSMGGFGSWRLAAEHPERFAAIIPICGGGLERWAPAMAHLPIWVFHGAKDVSVRPARSEQMVVALREYGSNVRLTVYPDVGHNSWNRAYETAELYEWMLKQRRVPVPARPPRKVKPSGRPITLELEDFTLKDAEIVDIPGTQGAKGVRFKNGNAEATFAVKLKPVGYEFSVHQYCTDSTDGRRNTVKFQLRSETWRSKTYRLQYDNCGRLEKAQGTERILIHTGDSYTLRFYMGKPGVMLDRIVITPLY